MARTERGCWRGIGGRSRPNESPCESSGIRNPRSKAEPRGRGRQDAGRFRVNWIALIACWDPLKKEGQRCQQTTETRFIKYHVRPDPRKLAPRRRRAIQARAILGSWLRLAWAVLARPLQTELAPLLLGMRLNRDTLPIAGEAHVTPSVVYISLTHIPLRNDENHGFSCKTVLRRLASENRLTGTANDGRGSDST